MASIRAYAKINIGLRVGEKRRDGYHNIETVMHRVNLYDEISYEEGAGVSMAASGIDVPVDESNLCVKAAHALRRVSGKRSGVRISLVKAIPVGSGLGGGSSDAAATLIALSKMWRLDFDQRELNDIAVGLGSDVPYFLNAGTAYATGRGESLEYLKLDLPFWILLVCPRVQVSTSWAYGRVVPAPAILGQSLKEIVVEHARNSLELRRLVRNDFEPIVLREYPEVAKARQHLEETGAEFVQMSGSGASVYGFYEKEQTALRASKGFDPTVRFFLTPPRFAPPL